MMRGLSDFAAMFRLEMRFHRDFALRVAAAVIILAELQVLMVSQDGLRPAAPFFWVRLDQLLLYAVAPLLGFLGPVYFTFLSELEGNAGRRDYFLTLPQGRFRTWLTKLAAVAFTGFSLTALAWLMPDPDNWPEIGSLTVINYLPKFLLVYAGWMALVLISSTSVTIVRTRGAKPSSLADITRQDLIMLAVLITLVLLFWLVASSVEDVNFSFTMLVLPVTAGIFTAFMGMAYASYSRAWITPAWAVRVLLTILVAAAAFMAFQFTYFRLRLHSPIPGERSEAVRGLRPLLPQECKQSVEQAFRETKDEQMLDAMGSLAWGPGGLNAELEDLWRWGVRSPDPSRFWISISHLAALGEDERLKDLMLQKLARPVPEDERKEYEYAHALVSFCPPSQRREMILALFRSGEPGKIKVARECAGLVPDDSYVPFLVAEFPRQKKDFDLYSLSLDLSRISLDPDIWVQKPKGKPDRGEQAKEAMAAWRQWYAQREPDNYHDRLLARLREIGIEEDPFILTRTEREELAKRIKRSSPRADLLHHAVQYLIP